MFGQIAMLAPVADILHDDLHCVLRRVAISLCYGLRTRRRIVAAPRACMEVDGVSFELKNDIDSSLEDLSDAIRVVSKFRHFPRWRAKDWLVMTVEKTVIQRTFFRRDAGNVRYNTQHTSLFAVVVLTVVVYSMYTG